MAAIQVELFALVNAAYKLPPPGGNGNPVIMVILHWGLDKPYVIIEDTGIAPAYIALGLNPVEVKGHRCLIPHLHFYTEPMVILAQALLHSLIVNPQPPIGRRGTKIDNLFIAICPCPPPSFANIPVCRTMPSHSPVVQGPFPIVCGDVQTTDIHIHTEQILLERREETKPVKPVPRNFLHRPATSAREFQTEIIPPAVVSRDATVKVPLLPSIPALHLNKIIVLDTEQLQKSTVGMDFARHGQIVNYYVHQKTPLNPHHNAVFPRNWWLLLPPCYPLGVSRAATPDQARKKRIQHGKPH